MWQYNLGFSPSLSLSMVVPVSVKPRLEPMMKWSSQTKVFYNFSHFINSIFTQEGFVLQYFGCRIKNMIKEEHNFMIRNCICYKSWHTGTSQHHQIPRIILIIITQFFTCWTRCSMTHVDTCCLEGQVFWHGHSMLWRMSHVLARERSMKTFTAMKILMVGKMKKRTLTAELWHFSSSLSFAPSFFS